MEKYKGVVIVAAVIVAGVVAYKVLKKSYDPIVFRGLTYSHINLTENNDVENHFFTPLGVTVDKADRFIQVVKYDDSALTDGQRKQIQAQVTRSFGLVPLEDYDDAFFGMFRRTLPVYAYMGVGVFVLHLGPETANTDTEALRAGAEDFINELAEIPTDF